MATNYESKIVLRPPLNFSKPLSGRFLQNRQHGEETVSNSNSGNKSEDTDSGPSNELGFNKFSGSATLSRSTRSKIGLPPPSTTFKGNTKLAEPLNEANTPETLIVSNLVMSMKEEAISRDKPNDPYIINSNKALLLNRKKETNQRSPIPTRNKLNLAPSKTAMVIDKMKQEREERRTRFAEARTQKQQQQGEAFEVARYVEMINEIRVELDTKMVGSRRRSIGNGASNTGKDVSIQVCVRKRPLSSKESNSHAFDIATSVPSKHRNTLSRVYVHEPKSRLDLTKTIETQWFDFDEVFDENSSNMQIYRVVGKPLVEKLFEGGNSTLFAYGQTGSGKTHTIFGSSDGQNPNVGVYEYVCRDLFRMKENYGGGALTITMCFFEIYGGKVFDLFSEKASVNILEDGAGNIQIVGLNEISVASLDEMLKCIERGNQSRTTASTEANATSSRSHAIFQIILRDSCGSPLSKFSLIDLAGSERASESGSTTKQSQFEGAEINKSLLALKECIRALSIYGDSKNGHVPFRGSKLTQVLRDALTGPRSNTVVIANISPSSLSCEHTLNTLRYAGRVKDLKSGTVAYNSVSEQDQDTDEDQSTFSSGNTDSEEFISMKEEELFTPKFTDVDNTAPPIEVFRQKLASLQRPGISNTEKNYGWRFKQSEPNPEHQATNEQISLNPTIPTVHTHEISFQPILPMANVARGACTSQEQIREANMEKGNKLIKENTKEITRVNTTSIPKSSRILRNINNTNNDISISPRHKLQIPVKTIDTNPLTPPPPFDPPTLSVSTEPSKTSTINNAELQEALDRLLKQQVYTIGSVDKLGDQEKRMLQEVNHIDAASIIDYPHQLEEILTEKIAILAAFKDLVLEFKQKSRQAVAWEKLKTAGLE
ncbi:Kinesin-like protein kif2a [Basidiobolus ranarum]|uniref:Kinesin-like protein n=1 Tax=Basidiobolus ranarum TaxID=34480 RepID=A0ABR2W5M7_9FUNG